MSYLPKIDGRKCEVFQQEGSQWYYVRDPDRVVFNCNWDQPHEVLNPDGKWTAEQAHAMLFTSVRLAEDFVRSVAARESDCEEEKREAESKQQWFRIHEALDKLLGVENGDCDPGIRLGQWRAKIEELKSSIDRLAEENLKANTERIAAEGAVNVSRQRLSEILALLANSDETIAKLRAEVERMKPKHIVGDGKTVIPAGHLVVEDWINESIAYVLKDADFMPDAGEYFDYGPVAWPEKTK